MYPWRKISNGGTYFKKWLSELMSIPQANEIEYEEATIITANGDERKSSQWYADPHCSLARYSWCGSTRSDGTRASKHRYVRWFLVLWYGSRAYSRLESTKTKIVHCIYITRSHIFFILQINIKLICLSSSLQQKFKGY